MFKFFPIVLSKHKHRFNFDTWVEDKKKETREPLYNNSQLWYGKPLSH